VPRLLLVRHGRAAAGWDADTDPGLDETGREQARRMAQQVAPLGPMDFLVSPMRRTRETAAALAELWGVAPRIEPRVSEIPSPTSDLKARGRWLREIAARRWSELEDEALVRWREALFEALGAIERDTVIVTHYIAINAAAGRAVGDERVVHFHPDYCSITEFRNDGGRLELIRYGAQADTRLL